MENSDQLQGLIARSKKGEVNLFAVYSGSEKLFEGVTPHISCICTSIGQAEFMAQYWRGCSYIIPLGNHTYNADNDG